MRLRQFCRRHDLDATTGSDRPHIMADHSPRTLNWPAAIALVRRQAQRINESGKKATIVKLGASTNATDSLVFFVHSHFSAFFF
ncbi:hypothetical protein ACFS07_07100 [Undibacterium arcticum]